MFWPNLCNYSFHCFSCTLKHVADFAAVNCHTLHHLCVCVCVCICVRPLRLSIRPSVCVCPLCVSVYVRACMRECVYAWVRVSCSCPSLLTIILYRVQDLAPFTVQFTHTSTCTVRTFYNSSPPHPYQFVANLSCLIHQLPVALVRCSGDSKARLVLLDKIAKLSSYPLHDVIIIWSRVCHIIQTEPYASCPRPDVKHIHQDRICFTTLWWPLPLLKSVLPSISILEDLIPFGSSFCQGLLDLKGNSCRMWFRRTVQCRPSPVPPSFCPDRAASKPVIWLI